MLKCEQVKPVLSEYIDHELPLWKMQMVRLHLIGCPDCSRELALFRGTNNLLKLGQDEVTTSDHFTDDVLAKVSIISRNEKDSVHFFQRFIHKTKTYAVWFRYSSNIRSHLGFVWKASFTLLLLMTLIGLFSLSPFYRPNSGENQSSVLVQKHEEAKTVTLIKVEFVQSSPQNHRSKKNLPSFGS